MFVMSRLCRLEKDFPISGFDSFNDNFTGCSLFGEKNIRSEL